MTGSHTISGEGGGNQDYLQMLVEIYDSIPEKTETGAMEYTTTVTQSSTNSYSTSASSDIDSNQDLDDTGGEYQESTISYSSSQYTETASAADSDGGYSFSGTHTQENTTTFKDDGTFDETSSSGTTSSGTIVTDSFGSGNIFRSHSYSDFQGTGNTPNSVTSNPQTTSYPETQVASPTPSEGEPVDWLGWVQFGLDAAGFIPGPVGNVADGINGFIHLYNRNYVEAGLSFAGAVPLLGQAAKYTAAAAKAAKAGSALAGVGKAVNAIEGAAKFANKAAGAAAKTGTKLVGNSVDIVQQTAKRIGGNSRVAQTISSQACWVGKKLTGVPMCFSGDTVVIAYVDQQNASAVAVVGLIPDPEEADSGLGWNSSAVYWVGLGVVGWVGLHSLERRRRRKEEGETIAVDRLFEADEWEEDFEDGYEPEAEEGCDLAEPDSHSRPIESDVTLLSRELLTRRTSAPVELLPSPAESCSNKSVDKSPDAELQKTQTAIGPPPPHRLLPAEEPKDLIQAKEDRDMIDLNSKSNRFGWLAKTWLLFCLLIAATLGFAWNLPGAAAPAPANNSVSRLPEQVATPISQIKLGQRVAGKNPLREQVEELEPDPETWRRISLRMEKDGGGQLWIELLRPLDWIEAAGAKPGRSIYLELHEMGAVGDAEVVEVANCPKVPSGLGTVVTGTFRHEADKNSNVILLSVEGQFEPTTVTANHAYWSSDRKKFVEVSNLRAGEMLDTLSGTRRVVEIKSVQYAGFLYNLETNEHVYRVGSLGSIVHNTCSAADFVRLKRSRQLADNVVDNRVFRISGHELNFVTRLRDAKPNLQIYRTNQKASLGDFLVIDPTRKGKESLGFLVDLKMGGGGAGGQLANSEAAKKIFGLGQLIKESGTTDELLKLFSQGRNAFP
ncbi:hypothetical protein M4951_17590 [Blastopirellula sp. J2-11]|uniref:hypothetical protein n=1 Tax=Blastopirellula sp. J2-11 TaxID=2943192 RepID=UPI0021C953D4|nr:hypothetical protein [Blastopirellula sp. J2-11]UUO05185.1 hypothetical protein M4951_17590 [Blastopirellula sp. J2-11]